MDSKSKILRELAEDKLIALLSKPEMDDADFAKVQTFCRVVETQAAGSGAYGLATYVNGSNREQILAAAARAVPAA